MTGVSLAREAALAGATRYFTGLACKHGHVAERMVSNGSCVECLRLRSSYAKTKAWRQANPGARAEEAKRYREKHPEKVLATKTRYRLKHLDEVRARDRAARKRLRATAPEAERVRRQRFEDRREAERAQLAGRPRAHACEICAAPGKTVFDHCHDRGHFRGWLCDRCNRVLGSVKDDIGLLRQLIAYLDRDQLRQRSAEA